jgi:hypothetical protein
MPESDFFSYFSAGSHHRTFPNSWIMLRVYISYAPADKPYLDTLLKWLKPLQEKYFLRIWHNPFPAPGALAPYQWDDMLEWDRICRISQDRQDFFCRIVEQVGQDLQDFSGSTGFFARRVMGQDLQDFSGFTGFFAVE